MNGPLEGVRVLDLTTVLMGPYACEMLAEHGADVIKVEEGQGEIGRQIGPSRSPGMGALYLGLNRSKRSLALNLKTPESIKIIAGLLKGSDVFVSNVRPAALERLGLSYDAVREINPRIIYCALVGYGTDGPYAGRAAFDDLIQGASAIPSVLAKASGGEPRYAPVNMADRTVGLHAAACISMALFHQQKTGEGQKIELPMFETMASFVLSDHLFGRAFSPPLGGAGYSRLLSKDRRPYPTKDGYICAVVYTDQQWRRFWQEMGRLEVAEDARFANMAARTRNVDEMLALLSGCLSTRTTAEWVELFDRLDVPCSPLNTLESLIEDPHLKAVGFFQEIDHPSEGRLVATRVPESWSKTPSGAGRECARIGQHTEEVLQELGLSDSDIDRLIAKKVVFAPISPAEAPPLNQVAAT